MEIRHSIEGRWHTFCVIQIRAEGKNLRKGNELSNPQHTHTHPCCLSICLSVNLSSNFFQDRISTAAAATFSSLVTASGLEGPGVEKAKSKKLEVGKTSDMFAMAAQSVIGRARERGEQDEEEKFCSFLAMKMRSVPKANKTAAQIAILGALDEFM
jgi:hypothetical protein